MGRRYLDFTAQAIVHDAFALSGDTQAAGMGFARPDPPLRFFGIHPCTQSVIFEGFFLDLLLAAQFGQALGRTETGVGMAFFDQFHAVVMVNPGAFALVIRSIGTPHIRTFVMRDAQPGQGLEDGPFALGVRR